MSVSTGSLLARVIPICFGAGAVMEAFMVNVKIGDIDFYSTAKRKAVERRNEKMEEECRYLQEQIDALSKLQRR